MAWIIFLALAAFLSASNASAAPAGTVIGGGGGGGASNSIDQGNSSVTVVDVGTGSVVTSVDGNTLIDVAGATSSVTLGRTGGGDTTTMTNLVVNGTVTSDLYVSTAADGVRGHTFVQNTVTHTCQAAAAANGFEIYADSSGSLDDIPLICDDAGTVSQIVTSTPPLASDSYRHKRLNDRTGNYTLVAADFRDGVITTTGSADAATLEFTLPTPTVAGLGGSVCFMDTDVDDQTIRVIPDTASTIRAQSPSNTTIADGLTTTAAYATMCVIAADATTWIVWQKKGSWTVVTITP